MVLSELCVPHLTCAYPVYLSARLESDMRIRSSEQAIDIADPMYNWQNWGNGIQNIRHAAHEHRISPNNAGSLVLKSGWPVRVRPPFFLDFWEPAT